MNMHEWKSSIPTELLTFAEAAALLGVDLAKVRRLVVEDRSLDFLVVDRGGRRLTLNLEGFLAEGYWQIDERGRICLGSPVYEHGYRVGMTYEPLDVMGELRIERASLDRLLQGTQPEFNAKESEDVASDGEFTVGGSDLPPGLTPDAIADAFDGVWGTRIAWRVRLDKAGPRSWLNTPPVLMRKGIRGRGPAGEPVVTLRNPVEVGKHVIIEKHGTSRAVNKRFQSSIELISWRGEWSEYRERAKNLGVDFGL